MNKEFLSSIKFFLLGLLGALLLRVLNSTLRWETVGLDGERRFWPHARPIVLAFWHGQQLLMPWVYLNGKRSRNCPPIVALISESKDGRIAASVMKRLGIDSIAGSSSRKGREAIFGLIDCLKNGSHVAITPDGPKGPVHQLKPGIIRIAQRSGAPIYPAAIAAENCWTFGSWDRMFLPKPFSRAVLMMGEEIRIPSHLDAEGAERYTVQVQDAINQLTARAEAHFKSKAASHHSSRQRGSSGHYRVG